MARAGMMILDMFMSRLVPPIDEVLRRDVYPYRVCSIHNILVLAYFVDANVAMPVFPHRQDG